MTDEEKQLTLNQIKTAREVLARNPGDPSLAMQFVKDLPATKEAGLETLAWLYGHEPCGYTPIGDARQLLDDLERFVRHGVRRGVPGLPSSVTLPEEEQRHGSR